MNALLNGPATAEILPIQVAESTQLLHEILEQPERAYVHLRRLAAAVILAAVYGIRGRTWESEEVQTVFRVQDQVSAILAPGATPPMDAFGFLTYLPDFLAGWRPLARRIHAQHREFYEGVYAKSVGRWKRGEGMECMITRLEKEREERGMSVANVVHTGSPILEAGSDTTSSTLQSFVLAMAANPRVLNKSQREVDATCGSGRLPGPADQKHLPYVQAVVQEESHTVLLKPIPTPATHSPPDRLGNRHSEALEGFR